MLRVQLSSDSSCFKILREPRAGAASLRSIVLAMTSSIGCELYETIPLGHGFHFCNSNYSGGRDKQMPSSRPVWAIQLFQSPQAFN